MDTEFKIGDQVRVYHSVSFGSGYYSEIDTIATISPKRGDIKLGREGAIFKSTGFEQNGRRFLILSTPELEQKIKDQARLQSLSYSVDQLYDTKKRHLSIDQLARIESILNE
jgi:hypothetical protein